MAGEVGVKWKGMLLNVCMYEGRTSKEWRMDLIVPIRKRKRGMHEPGKCRDITLLSKSTETAGERFRRKYQEKSRR